MTYATVFSGSGGWECGLDACGWELLWCCESEPFCRAVLEERFGVHVYPDVKTLVDERPAKVDALVGSPPCPPFSVAGNRRGVSDERHLWAPFAGAVRALEPRWVLVEQVAGILSDDAAFGQYVGELAKLGYCVLWHSIPARAVGAPHKARNRIWIVALADSESQRRGKARSIRSSRPAERTTRRGAPLPHPVSPGLAQRQEQSTRRELQTAERGNYEGTQWATEPGVGRVANGISHRVDRIKALGNAIIPQIAFEIGSAINEIEIEIEGMT